MKIRASPEANAFIRQGGGELFVWYAPVGGEWVVYRASTSRPSTHVEFREFDGGGFAFLLDRNIERPKSVDITLRRWPWRRLRVRGFRHEGPVAGDGGGGEGERDDVLWDTGGGGDGGGGGNGGGGNGGG